MFTSSSPHRIRIRISNLSQITSALGASALALMSTTLFSTPSAEAAASHFNTNPYSTGCASNSFTIASRPVSGGTMFIKASRNCSTNWVEYRGIQQVTVKSGKDSTTNAWTSTETDNVTVAVSMQSYAPGTTSYVGFLRIGDTTTTATCSYGCTWSVGSTSGTPAPSTSLNQKVDAFVSQWNGRYADYDGAYGAQCVDLAQFFNRDVVGAPFLRTPYSGGAKDIWQTADSSKYSRIGAGSAPRKGDLAVWGESQGQGYGHIAIVLGDAGSAVQTLTQNPGATRVANITKSGLLGYLRPNM